MESEESFDPSLFINDDYAWITIELDCATPMRLLASSAASTDWDLTGQIVWPASIALAQFICAVLGPSGLLRNQTLVELGAGAGVAGLAASRYVANTWLTDGSREVVELLEKTVSGDQEWTDKTAARRLAVVFLPWGASQDPGFDFLRDASWFVGADVIQWPNSLLPLINTITPPLNRGSIFLCGYVNRGEQLRQRLLSSCKASRIRVLRADWVLPRHPSVNILAFLHEDFVASTPFATLSKLVTWHTFE